MFVPTIRYKRVNDVQDAVDSVAQLRIGDDAKQPDSTLATKTEEKPSVTAPAKKDETTPTASEVERAKAAELKTAEIKTSEPETAELKTSEPKTAELKMCELKTDETQEEEPKAERVQEEPTIEIDPSDKERIVIRLTSGKTYTADRYCPHAGADLSYLGEVAEDEYPAEIGPVLMCTLHYWEFALEKAGRSGGGWASLNACPVPAHRCPAEANKKLDW